MDGQVSRADMDVCLRVTTARKIVLLGLRAVHGARPTGALSATKSAIHADLSHILEKKKLRTNRSAIKEKPPSARRHLGVFELKPGGVLLSHGEAPHYHRR